MLYDTAPVTAVQLTVTCALPAVALNPDGAGGAVTGSPAGCRTHFQGPPGSDELPGGFCFVVAGRDAKRRARSDAPSHRGLDFAVARAIATLPAGRWRSRGSKFPFLRVVSDYAAALGFCTMDRAGM